MSGPDEKAMQDAIVLKVLDGCDWVTAQQVADKLGWPKKSVVWSLTRLRTDGKIVAKLTHYPVPYRRGPGESRYEYRSMAVLPNWLMPQAISAQG